MHIYFSAQFVTDVVNLPQQLHLWPWRITSSLTSNPPQQSPAERLRLLLPSWPSCLDLRCLSLSHSYQMLSDGTTGPEASKHPDTICLAGKGDAPGSPPPHLQLFFFFTFLSFNTCGGVMETLYFIGVI